MALFEGDPRQVPMVNIDDVYLFIYFTIKHSLHEQIISKYFILRLIKP